MFWGVVPASMAACTSYAGPMACWTILGVFEACVAPILVIIIAMWYKKEEQGREVLWLYVCNRFARSLLIEDPIELAHIYLVRQKFWEVSSPMVLHSLTENSTAGEPSSDHWALYCCHKALWSMFLPDSPVKAVQFTDAGKIAALLRTKENLSGTQNAKLKKAQVIESLKDIVAGGSQRHADLNPEWRS